MLRLLAESLSIWLLAALLGVVTLALHPNAPRLDPPKHPLALTAQQILALERPALWLDARSEDAYLAGHLPGAVLLNETRWDELFGAFLLEHYEPGVAYVVYCDGEGCEASQQVAERLKEALETMETGVAVHFLEGGMTAWEGKR